MSEGSINRAVRRRQWPRLSALHSDKWAACLVGALLLAAAGAKLYGWNYQPMSETAWLAVPGLRMASVVFEGLLGLWLLTGISPAWSWLMSLGAFTFFAVVSAYSGWLGVASCGCFGTVTVSPWFSFGLDVGVLFLLSIFRPRWNSYSGLRAALRGMAKGAAGVAISAAAVLGLGRFIFCSPQEAMAFLRGEQIALEQSTVDLGVGQNGESKTADVTIQNWSTHPVRILSGHADCSCVVAEDLPIMIGPGGKVKVPIRVHYPPSSTGQFWKEVRLVTDEASEGQLVILVEGRVVPRD